ncbi:UDP-N-acetylglucosamine 2-epimerase (hydrolyzing) [Pseudochryseolinea flava]|uniref:UDP-N-acetylglucosamine 2-epimerase (Hydrolyzing) n=1 Tax=Pseudochryseolinea flava TaxID=2059302 RepID=A0A364Y2D4_9BACT|nr:UDP-N-acetylglucosamine 2-epimerase (hydrolyzing) [Pseudochryseolinea flava]
MPEKRKVCVVITARPSYSRIKTALDYIQRHPDLELQIVVAASALLDRYGSAVNVIERDGFKINAKVYNVLEGENLTAAAKTTGIGIIEISTVFDNLQPDIVVTIADRFETIATAIAASYMNIPLVHIQGGEVTGNIDEKVRHAITKMADAHFVSSSLAQERVIKMGEHPSKVFLTGCPSIDLAVPILQSTRLDFDPFQKYKGVGEIFNIEEPYIIVMQHPVTTEYESSRKHIEETLQAIDELKMPTLWFWPNVDAGADGTSRGIRVFREKAKPTYVHFFKNMEPDDFLKVLNQSRCLIGNSSVGIRESAYLGVPVVNIGSRQSGRERGKNVIDVGYDRKEITAAIREQVAHGHYPSENIYGDGNAGERIAALLKDIQLTVDKKLAY